MGGRNAFLCIGLSISFIGLGGGCSDVQFSAAGDVSGLGGPHLGQKFYTESFVQGLVSKKMDILFVVDNSGSMAEEQEKMGDRIGSFLGFLTDVDWRLGVTTTDVSNGPYGIKGELLNFGGGVGQALERSSPNYEERFKDTVQREESANCNVQACGSGDEQPLLATILAIQKRNQQNQNFFRNDADLAVMILTDEDELSIGPPGATHATDVIQEFQRAWSGEKRLSTYGMILEPGDSQCLNQQGGQGAYSTRAADLIQATNGLSGSICDEDYGATLGLLGERVRQLLDFVELEFEVSNPESVQLNFKPNHSTAFEIEGHRVYLMDPPPKGTVITVKYEGL